jgi:hypothetical protein
MKAGTRCPISSIRGSKPDTIANIANNEFWGARKCSPGALQIGGFGWLRPVGFSRKSSAGVDERSRAALCLNHLLARQSHHEAPAGTAIYRLDSGRFLMVSKV